MAQAKAKKCKAPVKKGRGRPRLFADVKALQARIEAYFKACDRGNQVYTIGGLAEALGMVRQTLLNYEGKPEFLDTIKKAKTRIEARIEELGLLGKVNPTFAIFWLKNNAGWRNEKQLDLDHKIVTQIVLFNDEESKSPIKAVESTKSPQGDSGYLLT